MICLMELTVIIFYIIWSTKIFGRGEIMDQGLELLIKKHREIFWEENRNFYSDEDYKEAERKFIKFCLTGASNNA